MVIPTPVDIARKLPPAFCVDLCFVYIILLMAQNTFDEEDLFQSNANDFAELPLDSNLIKDKIDYAIRSIEVENIMDFVNIKHSGV